jgi:anti-sigma B factor antagonist
LLPEGARAPVTGWSADFIDPDREGSADGGTQKLARQLMVLLQVSLQPGTAGDMLVVQGDLDEATSAQLREHLERVRGDGVPALAIDLRGCLAVDGGSLRALIEDTSALLRSGVPLAIVSGRPQVRQALREAGLASSVSLCWTPQAAIAALAASPSRESRG